MKYPGTENMLANSGLKALLTGPPAVPAAAPSPEGAEGTCLGGGCEPICPVPSQPTGVVNVLPRSETAADSLEAAPSQEGLDISADTQCSSALGERQGGQVGAAGRLHTVGQSVHGQSSSHGVCQYLKRVDSVPSSRSGASVWLSGEQRAKQRRVWARVDAERLGVRGGGGHGHCPRSLGSLASTWSCRGDLCASK